MRVILTTSRDNQEQVDIPLFRYTEDDPSIPEAWLATLSLGNLDAGTRDEQEISLVLTFHGEGSLEAVATEIRSGNRDMVSVALDSPLAPDPFAVPAELSDRALFSEREEQWRAPRGSRGRGYLWVALLLVLLLALTGVLLYMLPRFRAEDTGPPAAEVVEPAATEEPAEELTEAPAEEPVEAAEADTRERAVPAPPDTAEPPDTTEPPDTVLAPDIPAPPETPVPGEDHEPVSYRIMLGDTLWDISERYYGTPWLYPEIADRNRIRNPNLIFAEDRILLPEVSR